MSSPRVLGRQGWNNQDEQQDKDCGTRDCPECTGRRSRATRSTTLTLRTKSRRVRFSGMNSWSGRRTRPSATILVLPHCPKELGQELKKSTKWGGGGREQPRCGYSSPDDTRYCSQQEGEERERDDDRGKQHRALHNHPGSGAVTQRLVQGFKA